MSINQKQLEKILDENSDLRTYFNSKSDSRNWMIDALLEFNDEMANHGSNKVVKNIMKTSAEPVFAGTLLGVIGGLCGTIVLFATDNPVFLILGASAGVIAGVVAGGVSEKKRPEVNDWKPAQTATIRVFKERARNYKPS